MTRHDQELANLPKLPIPVLWRIGLRELDLRPMAKLTGFTIDTYVGGNPSGRVAVPTIATRAGISERTVQGAQKLLEEAELFEIRPGGGHGKTNVYVRRFTLKTAQVVRGFFERAAETPQLTLEAPHLTIVNPAAAAGEVGVEVGLEVEDPAAHENDKNQLAPCDVCGRRLLGGPYGDGLWLCNEHIATYRKAASS